MPKSFFRGGFVGHETISVKKQYVKIIRKKFTGLVVFVHKIKMCAILVKQDKQIKGVFMLHKFLEKHLDKIFMPIVVIIFLIWGSIGRAETVKTGAISDVKRADTRAHTIKLIEACTALAVAKDVSKQHAFEVCKEDLEDTYNTKIDLYYSEIKE